MTITCKYTGGPWDGKARQLAGEFPPYRVVVEQWPPMQFVPPRAKPPAKLSYTRWCYLLRHVDPETGVAHYSI